MEFTITKAANWYEVGLNLQEKSFSVPGISDLNILKAIFELLNKSHESGSTYRDFKKELLKKYDEQKFSEILDDPSENKPQVQGYNQFDSTLKCTYQIFNKVLYEFKHFARRYRSRERRGIWKFDAVDDQKASDLEKSLNNNCFRFDDEIWEFLTPPNSPFDRIGIRTLSQRQLEKRELEIKDSSDKLHKEKIDLNSSKVETTAFISPENNLSYAYPGWDANFYKLWS